MKYRLNLCLVVCLALCQSAFAEDLFSDGNAREITPLTTLSAGTTMGGYPLFEGGRSWKLVSSKATSNNKDIRIGIAQMISPQGGNYFAEMSVTAALGGGAGGEDGYFSADICNPAVTHLYRVNRGAGTTDNCLTVDPYAATIRDKPITTLLIRVRNAQSNWRLYDVSLVLNLAPLGFQNTATSDWSEMNIASDSKKRAFLTKVFVWSRQLQDAVNKAIAYSKPQDAFAGVPPLSTLFEDGAAGLDTAHHHRGEAALGRNS